MHKISLKEVNIYPLINWLTQNHQIQFFNHHHYAMLDSDLEDTHQVNWLIETFNHLFLNENVKLIKGQIDAEPEYFPADVGMPARIVFAHGFFASALHEISHWCIAGQERRALPDYGYWYEPDGRSSAQQARFESVEVKPQAIECLLTLMCGKTFHVSVDNLNGLNNSSKHGNLASSEPIGFSDRVFNQVKTYIQNPQTLPKDAKYLLTSFIYLCEYARKQAVE